MTFFCQSQVWDHKRHEIQCTRHKIYDFSGTVIGLHGCQHHPGSCADELPVTRPCVRCGAQLQDNCDAVCVPCLLLQGERYCRTGNPRVFLEASR